MADPDGPVTVAGKTLLHQTRDATPVTSMAWSGSTVASAAEDGSVIVWEVTSGAVVARREFGASASAITVDTHGRRVAAASYSDRIQVREIDGWQLLVDLPEGDANVISLVFSPDGGALGRPQPAPGRCATGRCRRGLRVRQSSLPTC